MRLQISARWGLIVVTTIGLLVVSACGTKEPAPTATPTAATAPAGPLKDEIPASELAAVMAAHYKGLGHMERYEYRDAIAAFRDLRNRAPGWIPGAINLAIALLNDTGQKAEDAKKAGEDPAPSNFDESLDLLAGVLDREPENPYAHFCRGIIFQQIGQRYLIDANRHFKRVTEIDPTDAAAWYWLASTVSDQDDSARSDVRKLAPQQIPLFKKALELDPYMASAIYKLAFAYAYIGQIQKQKELLANWTRMKPDQEGMVPGPGVEIDLKYGDMGKYGNVVNPFPPLDAPEESRTAGPGFDAAVPLDVKLPEGDRWVKEADFTGSSALAGRVRARFGATVSAFDADGDGKLDLYLTSAVAGPKGIRDVLLLNKGDGRFEDASAAFGLPVDRASVGVAAGDFDADRHIDLFLTGIGDNRLLRNREGKNFEDISSTLKPMGAPAVSLMARWLDLDQDGDLDLYVVNYCAAELADKAFIAGSDPPPGLANIVYRNDGVPDPGSAATIQGRAPVATAFGPRAVEKGLSIVLVPWSGAEPILGGVRAHTGVALLDIDNDRDLDLVLTAEKSSPVALLNDRLGVFHEAPIEGIPARENLSGLLATHVDTDGRSDLVAACWTGPVLAWRNTTLATASDKTRITFETWPINATRWRAAQAIDLDLDGRTDLLGLPSSPGAPGDPVLASWARNEGKRFAAKTLSVRAENPTLAGITAVDLVGDPLPDILILRPGAQPALARNTGNGQRWLVFRLGGYWRVKPELMRTNSHAIGTRLTLEGQGVYVPYDHTTQESGLGQSVAPVVLGLGSRGQADLVHLRWPDGVMQCELNQVADQKVDLAENNRKTGSCPVLFTWNGRRYVCIGDFLGGGGLGYLVAPGVYGQPDRDEAMAISSEQLQPSEGVYRLSITEPMDEIAYLDHVMLDVVDRPPGLALALDERFAPEGPRPTGELLAWRTAIAPERAADLKGRDVTETLRSWDRRTVDGFRKLTGWVGYAEEHGIILDFGTRLSGYGPTDRLVICLAGWVEYPYSQTNYAAATAGVHLNPPAIERLDADGKWQVIEPHAGYPAGLPRLMTLDLTGKLVGPRCVLRIKTNMECYYDQAFIAVRDRAAEKSLRTRSLPVARAVLGYRGYTRETSPDGEQPLIYDYDYVDPAPLARFSGKLTRHGDVARLLQSDDDQLCLVGAGDELRLEFKASGLPPLPPGWARSFVLRSAGYCKDADPFTAGSDTVEPLPWRGMPPFPFDREIRRLSDPAYESYLRTYQTRSAGEDRRR